jgi:protein-tyrosine-phosphatase
VRVLFVCTGNTCRSPFAAAIARREGLDAASAGLTALEGDEPPADAVAIAAEYGVDLESHRARLLTSAMLDEADVVVGVTRDHVVGIQAEGGTVKARQLDAVDVDDPIGLGPDAYRRAYAQMERAVHALAEELR